jgi:hypothetical protein
MLWLTGGRLGRFFQELIHKVNRVDIIEGVLKERLSEDFTVLLGPGEN